MNSLCEEALKCVGRGWSVFPLFGVLRAGVCACPSGPECGNKCGKHPKTTRGFKDATKDQDSVRSFMVPFTNYGIPTGEQTFVAIDIDAEKGGLESISALEIINGKLPSTVKVFTGKNGGYHLYFKSPPGGVQSRTNVLPGVDIRGEGGYVVGSGSDHRSGGKYCYDLFEGDPDEVSIADMPEWMVQKLCSEKQKATATDSSSEKIKEGSRNDSLFRLGSSLRSRGLSRDAIEAALQKENLVRCEPPLPEKEIMAIATSAGKYEAPDYAGTVDVSALLTMPKENTPDWGRAMGGKKFNFLPLDVLLKKPDEVLPYIVDDILIEGGTSLFAGKPKAGKSTLAQWLALKVVRGEQFLGKNTKKSKILYLALEEKESQLRAHFKAMGAEYESELLIHAAPAPQEKTLEELFEEIVKHKPGLVIIDTVFRLIREVDVNDYGKINRSLEPIGNIARLTNTHIALVHHMGKAEREGADGVLGSTAIAGLVDAILMVRRDESGRRTLRTQMRYGFDIPEAELIFDGSTRAINLGSEVDKEKNAVAEITESIAFYLESRAVPVDEGEIHDNVHGKKQTKVRVLREMLKSGAVRRSGKGGKGDPFQYFIASEDKFLFPTLGEDQGNKEIHVGGEDANP